MSIISNMSITNCTVCKDLLFMSIETKRNGSRKKHREKIV